MSISKHDKPLSDKSEMVLQAISSILESARVNKKPVKPRLRLTTDGWRNRVKDPMKLYYANLTKVDLSQAYLVKSILQHAAVQEADLRKANLSEADLSQADFSEANLKDAILKDANISGTNFATAKNLTKEQILSAKWSGSIWKKHRPKLPEKFLQDKRIQKWLAKPQIQKSSFLSFF